jgi:uncharacterized damage-inducible protein DinB
MGLIEVPLCLKSNFVMEILSTLALLFALSTTNSEHMTHVESGPVHPLDTLSARYAHYNLWANTQMKNWLEEATTEQMNLEIESSFTSLRKTAMHIWNAEYLWLAVLKNESYEDMPANTFDGDERALLQGWLATSEAFYTYIASLSPEQLRGTRSSGADRPPLYVSDIIQHCMNHSTYHRGQLITMGRQAGLVSPPRTDFIYYVRR